MQQLQNNKLPKLLLDLFGKIDTVCGHSSRHATKNICFWPGVKKCIIQNLLVFRGSKLRTNIDNVYQNKKFSTATFKKHYKKFCISKY